MTATNNVQALQFALMRATSFNAFDGNRVVSDLEAHPELWRGAVMLPGRDAFLIPLRDIEDGYWNVDTLYILPQLGREGDLEALARAWDADEVDWLNGHHACRFMGEWSKALEAARRVVLRVWWD